MNILVTGGAGFIGSHITDQLIRDGHNVTILDDLSSTKGVVPDYINPKALFVKGDVLDRKVLDPLVMKADAIFHEAASVGIAQSNYEIDSFVKNNCLGNGVLLQSIIDTKRKPKLIISASNTTYGEGLYSCESHGNYHPEIRSDKDIKDYGFEPVCPDCLVPGTPVPTPESVRLNCNSIYALTKKFQEESSLVIGKLYDFPVVLLKYFNVFGPRQSLSNPYTGVSAIFTSRIKNNQEVSIYEDGLQTRDFVSVHDVVEANMFALNNPQANYQTFNVGSGRAVNIIHVAEYLYKLFDKKPNIKITGQFRKGDIRHCVADNSKIRAMGWNPKVSFEEGLEEIINWSKTQSASVDFEKAQEELKKRSLV